MGTKNGYDVSEKAYKWWYDNIVSRYYNLMVAYCFLPFGGEKKARAGLIDEVTFQPGERILDMCCGTGNATFITAEKAPADVRITGLDLSTGQIRVATRKNRFPNVDFIAADATSIDFPDCAFDKVFIPHAVHEMFHDLRMRVLREARRVLRDGGQLIVLELDSPDSLLLRLLSGLWLFYWLPFNFETPTRREMLRIGLENEVREAGFRNVTKTPKHRGLFQVVTGEK